MVRVVVVVLMLFLSSCTWSHKDKTLLSSYYTLSTVDVIQTAQNNNGKELNSVMQNNKRKPDMTKVIGIKLLAGVTIYLIADSVPSIRTELLWVGNIVQGGVVLWNF